MERPIDKLLAFAHGKGISQTQLAEKLGVTPQHITNWKRRGMPAEWHMKAADAVGANLLYLLATSPVTHHGGEGSEISLRAALNVVDQAAQRMTPRARAELQKVFDLYLTDPRRYSGLMDSIEELLSGELPPSQGELKAAGG